MFFVRPFERILLILIKQWSVLCWFVMHFMKWYINWGPFIEGMCVVHKMSDDVNEMMSKCIQFVGIFMLPVLLGC
jgi:mannose/fructose/N-acetylgalactosamine-specific phosphotransferase system component IID